MCEVNFTAYYDEAETMINSSDFLLRMRRHFSSFRKWVIQPNSVKSISLAACGGYMVGIKKSRWTAVEVESL